MWFKRFTEYVLSSRIVSGVLAFVTSVIPLPGGSLGSLVAVLVTLRKGAYEGSLIFFAVLAASVLNYAMGRTSATAQLLLIATVLTFAVNLLTCLFAVVLERTRSWSLIVELGAMLGIAALLIVHLVFPEIASWWATQLTQVMDQMQSANSSAAIPDAQLVRADLIAKTSHYMSGFLIASLLSSAWLQVLMGRWWQAIVFNPGGLRPELHAIRFGRFAGVALILPLLLLGVWHGFAVDCLPVIVVAFTVAGLSLIHALVARLKRGWFILVLVYVSILLTFPLGAIIVALFALLDIAVNFRGMLRFKS
ncbi:MAG: hypothetical protein SFW66_02215 [Gammaproteobacteria bacterium]|nr:hypothetical protein [Gammaproteobacteria bacterium]